MKKLTVLLMVVMTLAANAYGAGTIVVSDPVYLAWGRNMVTVTFTCTADAADQSYPAAAINQDNADVNTDLIGYWLSHVKVVPGATGPTDNSDLTITVNGEDILGGNGANIVDNATGGHCVPYGSNGDAQYPMTGDVLTLNLTGNAVNSAVVTVTLVFEK